MKPARSYSANSADLSEAVADARQAWEQGGLVVFPTETVYGVGAWLFSDESLAAQQRIRLTAEKAQQFTVHLSEIEVGRRFIDDTQPGVWPIVSKLLAAPVTVVVDVPEAVIEQRIKALKLSDAAATHLYQQGTVSLRYPSDPVARRILGVADGMVVAGGVPTEAAPVVDGDQATSIMAESAAVIINTGRTRYAKPSTVVRVNHDGKRVKVALVREGVLDERSIKKLSQLNLLMVCSGNTCRSPMAAGVARKLLSERHDISVQQLSDSGLFVTSAGSHTAPGFPATAEAVAVAERRGIDLKQHRSQPITRELLNEADFIFCMTRGHLQAVLHLAPDAADRAMLLGPTDVADPIGAGIGRYEQTIEQIEKAVADRLEQLNL